MKSSMNMSEKGDVTTVEWIPLDMCFGVPLFDDHLNEDITRKLVKHGLCNPENLSHMTTSAQLLSLEVLHFISEWQENIVVPSDEMGAAENIIPHPSRSILFMNGKLSQW